MPTTQYLYKYASASEHLTVPDRSSFVRTSQGPRTNEIYMRSPATRSKTPEFPSKIMSLSPNSVVDLSEPLPIRKVVRFQNGGFATDQIPNNLKPASEMSFMEKTLIWWQPIDFYMFKKTSKMMAKEILRRQSAEMMPSSYSSIMQRTYSVCSQTAEEANDSCPLSEKDRHRLGQWREDGICRRGLERWTFPELAKDRLRRKDVAVRAVIEVQNRFVKSMNLDVNTGAEFIRKSSEQLTRYVSTTYWPIIIHELLTSHIPVAPPRSTRLFGRALGEADAIIAAAQSEGDEPLVTMEQRSQGLQ